jgi:hypothetical protein
MAGGRFEKSGSGRVGTDAAAGPTEAAGLIGATGGGPTGRELTPLCGDAGAGGGTWAGGAATGGRAAAGGGAAGCTGTGRAGISTGGIGAGPAPAMPGGGAGIGRETDAG